jgi:hypothetical protein
LPLAGFGVRYLVVRKYWKGAAAFAVSFAILLIVHELAGSRLTSLLLMYFIVGVTWWTGLEYLFGIRALAGRGRIGASDIVRLMTAFALPFIAVAAQTVNLTPKLCIIALVSIELAHGGLDNLLAHHRAHQGALGWGVRLGAECGLLGYSLVATSAAAAWWDALAALAVGAIGLTIAFVQKRSFYLDSPSVKPAVAASKPAAQLVA